MYPRYLNHAERALIEHLLTEDFPCAVELRAQVRHPRVTRPWTANSISVDLAIPDRSPRASFTPTTRDPAVFCWPPTAGAGEPLGSVLLWVDAGRLSASELAWVTDEKPTEFPQPAQVSLDGADYWGQGRER